MEYDSISNLKFKAQGDTVRSDFSSRYKRNLLEDYREKLQGIMRNSQYKKNDHKINFLRQNVRTKDTSLNFNHYQDMISFKSKANKVFAASSRTPQLKIMPYEYALRDKAMSQSSIYNESLQNVIKISTLSIATNLVRDGGLYGISEKYLRRLEKFCNEVIRN
ncbi:hypothetical protein SteCoe_28072 [Stentor coeruleus]|uniref:Uncharacterized protein n=1 Tax=Stentor coeruleus TaxID=5963 RepID=A0A1R2B952_9CILI|nr:hypothetical protein SteCoe_28072 [Stentor coeruleus]